MLRPREALAALGATHLLLVERDLAASPGEHPLGAIVAGREPLWTVSPTDAESSAQVCLPLGLDFALGTLWSTERPGPRMTLYLLP